jgi:spore coat protein U-like protein
MIARRRVPLLVLLGLIASVPLSSTLHAAGCTVGTSGIAFGPYSVFSSASTNTTGTISYTCTAAVDPPVIKLSRGLSPSFTPRAMSTTGDSLAYNVFLDASCTTVWGDGTSVTAAYSAPPPVDGHNYNVTIYGCIPPRQNIRAGSYSDFIVVTIEF